MKCYSCGEEMINTFGANYHCPKCLIGINDLLYRWPNVAEPYLPDRFERQDRTGWVCPKCGSSNAPWVDQCVCSIQQLTMINSPLSSDATKCQQYNLNISNTTCDCVNGIK